MDQNLKTVSANLNKAIDESICHKSFLEYLPVITQPPQHPVWKQNIRWLSWTLYLVHLRIWWWVSLCTSLSHFMEEKEYLKKRLLFCLAGFIQSMSKRNCYLNALHITPIANSSMTHKLLHQDLLIKQWKEGIITVICV